MAAFEGLGGISLLLVSSGMKAGSLCAVVEALKASSKNAGSHKRRQIYWAAYGGIASKLAGQDGAVDGLFTFTADADGEGTVAFTEFTKRQKHAFASGSVELMGKKHRPLDEADGKGWCSCYGEEEAQACLEDLRSAEQCVYVTPQTVYVGTRFKRRHCKNVTVPLKAVKDVEKFVADLPPCLQSVNLWTTDQQAPTLMGYNILLAGVSFPADLPAALAGRVDSTSPADVYDAFLERRSAHFIAEAHRLVDQMLADNGRGEVKPLICAASMKDAATAKRNALMKKVYVHESKTKFIQAVKTDGDVNMSVVTGDISNTRFNDFGGIVFELFYRTDLAIFS